MSRKDVYKSKAWKTTRLSYIISKNCLCERCGMPIYATGISDYMPKGKRIIGIVHHKEYLNENNYVDDKVSYSWDNLELLCKDCHEQEHHKDIAKRNNYAFDEYGNLIEIK